MLKYFQITINIYFALMLLFCSNIYVTIMINNFIIIDTCYCTNNNNNSNNGLMHF